jgi:hypothetical protein
MHIERVPNRGSKPCILLRESYREGAQVRKRTLSNITHWPEALVGQFEALLKGGRVVGEGGAEDFEVVRSLPHGHVAAVLGTLRHLGLDEVVSSTPCWEQRLCLAMIVARVIGPRSKLATARGLAPETAVSTLGEELAITDADETDLYAAMDWLLRRQPRIEGKLARRHLKDGTLVLYDVTSSYFEGRTCPLARHGHPRDGKRDKLQIVYGLLCDPDGRPVAVEVFAGNTGDPSTLVSQVRKIRQRFGIEHVVLVGDRGMLTDARLRTDIRGNDGLDWITALRATAIRKLVGEGSLQLSLFDDRDLAEIASPDFPGERLIVCRNPLLAEERRRKRDELLAATDRQLAKVAAAVARPRRPLRDAASIGLRVGRIVNQFKMAKHFRLEIGDTAFTYERDAAHIAAEEALDGIYVIRTSVPVAKLSSVRTVEAYKSLSRVERAFRSIKTVDLKVRPIHHRLARRVRAHVFLCMLAYYVEWHMREALTPLLFDDENRAEAARLRTSPVAPARRSASADTKAATKRTAEDLPVHSFQTLLADLGTIARNRMQTSIPGAPCFERTTRPTPVQRSALDRLSVPL